MCHKVNDLSREINVPKMQQALKGADAWVPPGWWRGITAPSLRVAECSPLRSSEFVARRQYFEAVVVHFRRGTISCCSAGGRRAPLDERMRCHHVIGHQRGGTVRIGGCGRRTVADGDRTQRASISSARA